MSAGEIVHGTWKLVSWITEVIETKERHKFFGDAPGGFIHFTKEGRVFAILAADGRKPVATEADQVSAFASLVAYTGRYRVDGDRLITTVDISADPALVGTDLIRRFKCDGDALEIVTAPFVSNKPSQALRDNLLQSFLVWRRELA